MTEGRAGTDAVRGVGETTMDAVRAADCTGLLLSVTVAVKLEVPLAVGIPEINPEGDKVSPEGRLPAVMDQLYGAVPPLTWRLCE